MATRAQARSWQSFVWAVFWALLLSASLWFLFRAYNYVITRDPQPGSTLLNRQLWYYGHMVAAVPLLFIAPLQFSQRLRSSKPRVHRRLGKLFLGGSILAGLLASYIGATIQYEGSRLPLTMFGLVWAGFAIAAWLTARAKAFPLHRKFVIRTYALALAFVWVRVLEAFDSSVFPFIQSQDVRDTTTEWLSFVLPLMVVEFYLSWWPDLRKSLRA
jgi:hypothetical protein